MTLGGLADQVRDASRLLAGEGIGADIYNLRFATPLDRDNLMGIMRRYELVVFLEEGVRQGGVGEMLASLIVEEEEKVNFMNLSVPNGFPPAATREELIALFRLDGESLFRCVLDKWQSYRFRQVVDQVKNDTWEPKKL